MFKKKNVLIGDSGTVEKPDKWTVIITSICVIVMIILIFHGVMAYVVA